MLSYVLTISILIYLSFPRDYFSSPKTCLPATSLQETSLPSTSLPATSLLDTLLPKSSLHENLLEESSLPDIVLAPGGATGFYMLGISHYIVNHFEIKDKKMVGFSAGSFNAIFMRLSHEKRIVILKEIFKCEEKKMLKVMSNIMNLIETHTELSDYEFGKTSIAVAHTDGLGLYDTFLTIEQLVRCCRSSSFVPFITHSSGINFYNHKIAMDGFFRYKTFLKKYERKPLVISPTMFDRYRCNFTRKIKFVLGLHALKYDTIYQMYLNGYQDATRNHSYFESYLKPIELV